MYVSMCESLNVYLIYDLMIFGFLLHFLSFLWDEHLQFRFLYPKKKTTYNGFVDIFMVVQTYPMALNKSPLQPLI